MGYLMPKWSLEKNRSDIVYPIAVGGDKEVHAFPKGINLKMNTMIGIWTCLLQGYSPAN